MISRWFDSLFIKFNVLRSSKPVANCLKKEKKTAAFVFNKKEYDSYNFRFWYFILILLYLYYLVYIRDEVSCYIILY